MPCYQEIVVENAISLANLDIFKEAVEELGLVSNYETYNKISVMNKGYYISLDKTTGAVSIISVKALDPEATPVTMTESLNEIKRTMSKLIIQKTAKKYRWTTVWAKNEPNKVKVYK